MFSFLSLLLEVIQMIIAVEASIVCFILAALTLGGSAVGLTLTAPLFAIFSPILVPATIVTAVLNTGFTVGGTLGALAIALVRNKMAPKEKNKKGSSLSPSSQNLLEMPITGGYGGSFGGKPFSGTFGDKLAAATAPPAAATAPPAGGSPGHGYGGFLTNVPLEKLFPGFFGPNHAGGAGSPPGGGTAVQPATGTAPAAAASPAGKKPAAKKPAPAKKPVPAKKPAAPAKKKLY